MRRTRSAERRRTRAPGPGSPLRVLFLRYAASGSAAAAAPSARAPADGPRLRRRRRRRGAARGRPTAPRAPPAASRRTCSPSSTSRASSASAMRRSAVLVLGQHRVRPLVAVRDDALDLLVDLDRRVLAVVLVLRDLAAEEDLLFLLAEGERPHRRRSCPTRRPSCARGRSTRSMSLPAPVVMLSERDLLGDAAAEQDRDLVLQVRRASSCASRRPAAAASGRAPCRAG